MKFAKGLVGFVTWMLFAASFLLLANQTWYALQGAQPNYGTEGAATIITIIISCTTLDMLLRIMLQMDETPLQFGVTILLMGTALTVDIAVAMSVIFDLDFPEQFALLVVVAHVVVHVLQYTIIAMQNRKGALDGNSDYSPDATALVEIMGMLRDVHRCEDCGRVFKSERGLQQHQRYCKAK